MHFFFACFTNYHLFRVYPFTALQGSAFIFHFFLILHEVGKMDILFIHLLCINIKNSPTWTAAVPWLTLFSCAYQTQEESMFFLFSMIYFEFQLLSSQVQMQSLRNSVLSYWRVRVYFNEWKFAQDLNALSRLSRYLCIFTDKSHEQIMAWVISLVKKYHTIEATKVTIFVFPFWHLSLILHICSKILITEWSIFLDQIACLEERRCQLAKINSANMWGSSFSFNLVQVTETADFQKAWALTA